MRSYWSSCELYRLTVKGSTHSQTHKKQQILDDPVQSPAFFFAWTPLVKENVLIASAGLLFNRQHEVMCDQL